MKLLRSIRLDPSDTFIFASAAEPGEFAVAGSFAFWDEDVLNLRGKRAAAFRAGFLGLTSGGFSTLAQVCVADDVMMTQAEEQLAALLARDHGAPDIERARDAAREEIAATAAIADHAEGTLIAMRRFIDDAGEIREQFRTLHRRASNEGGADPRHYRAFIFFDDETTEAEMVDFDALAKGRSA